LRSRCASGAPTRTPWDPWYPLQSSIRRWPQHL
jgi:hypothetical protein